MNRKLATFAIVSIFLLTSFAMLPVAGITSGKEYTENPWTPEDEGDHFPCATEWWCFHAALELENGDRWDALGDFQYETYPKSGINKTTLLMYYFNRDNGKCRDFSVTDNTGSGEEMKLSFKKNVVDLKYNNCTMKGLYPTYIIHFEDPDKTFILDIQMDAVALPHWAFQEATDGSFPWFSEGSARYGWITRLDVSGNITIDGVKSNVTGVGYYERLWGNFSHNLNVQNAKPKYLIKNLLKNLDFIRWYRSERSVTRSRRMTLSTDNAFGYDWVWAAFDNGWSLHFGVVHVFSFIAEGPARGLLSLNADGESYWEFIDIHIKQGRVFLLKNSLIW